MIKPRNPRPFDGDERLRALSARGGNLDRIKLFVVWEAFRPDLGRSVARSERRQGGRPALDHVLMFKVLVLQSMHGLSDERTEYLIKDRLSFIRFMGMSLADPVPDANTTWNTLKH